MMKNNFKRIRNSSQRAENRPTDGHSAGSVASVMLRPRRSVKLPSDRSGTMQLLLIFLVLVPAVKVRKYGDPFVVCMYSGVATDLRFNGPLVITDFFISPDFI